MPKKSLLVTSGPTREYIDSVRYISNHSTGELGSLICDTFANAGWEIDLIHGKGAALPSNSANCHEIITAEDAYNAVETKLQTKSYDAAIHLMGVADYSPIRKPGKIGSYHDELVIYCKPTKKIIPLFKTIQPDLTLVSFKLEDDVEVEELKRRGLTSLNANQGDFVVVNRMEDISESGHKAVILSPDGQQISSAKNKQAISEAIYALFN